jgi:glycosyltransferase involved in cell wall biosynthesis
MAIGLPVVATSVGGIPELVEDGVSGWLCPASQPCKLAELMVRLAQAKDGVEMGARARQRVIQDYSLERMTENYEILFQEVLASPGASHHQQMYA